MSFYNMCLLITKDKGIKFSITGHQTDNIVNIGTVAFINKKKAEIIEMKFEFKSQIILETCTWRNFNDYHMIVEDKAIMIIQKYQADKLLIIDIENNAKKQQYMKQRICSTYIMWIYKLKTTFDYFIITQSKELINDDIVLINK